ncbi:hypothetical protein J6590_025101 [Homalodisca vitripennis]|nr:hypothetical protein J6590_025101 [Homalodisca vitripennis]
MQHRIYRQTIPDLATLLSASQVAVTVYTEPAHEEAWRIADCSGRHTQTQTAFATLSLTFRRAWPCVRVCASSLQPVWPLPGLPALHNIRHAFSCSGFLYSEQKVSYLPGNGVGFPSCGRSLLKLFLGLNFECILTQQSSYKLGS